MQTKKHKWSLQNFHTDPLHVKQHNRRKADWLLPVSNLERDGVASEVQLLQGQATEAGQPTVAGNIIVHHGQVTHLLQTGQLLHTITMVTWK